MQITTLYSLVPAVVANLGGAFIGWQCTDKLNNIITPILIKTFGDYPNPKKLDGHIVISMNSKYLHGKNLILQGVIIVISLIAYSILQTTVDSLKTALMPALIGFIAASTLVNCVISYYNYKDSWLPCVALNRQEQAKHLINPDRVQKVNAICCNGPTFVYLESGELDVYHIIS